MLYCVYRLIGSRIIGSAIYCNQTLKTLHIEKHCKMWEKVESVMQERMKSFRVLSFLNIFFNLVFEKKMRIFLQRSSLVDIAEYLSMH